RCRCCNTCKVASVSAAEDKPAEGKRLGAYAATLGVHPYDLSVQMLRRNGGSVGMIGFAMPEPNLERIYAHPQGMIASDGGSYAIAGPARRGVPHPRQFGITRRAIRLPDHDLAHRPEADAGADVHRGAQHVERGEPRPDRRRGLEVLGHVRRP
ncbi:MAG: hypothetical protein ACKOH8_00735, partial [Gemmatimonadota bacterium]